MTTIDQQRIESNWRAIRIELDAPRPSLAERALRRIGVSSGTSRLVAATPALRRSWFGALAFVVLAGLASFDTAQARDSLFVLLLLAPLAPAIGVSMAFGGKADPSHEIAVATPVRGLRLVLLRTSTTLVVSLLALVATALLSPERSAYAFAWLVPSLALTSATLALMTTLAPRRAAATSIVAWVTIVAAVGASTSDRLATFGVVGQIAALIVTGIGAAATFARRDRFDQLAVQR